jgi:hypothetical protein
MAKELRLYAHGGAISSFALTEECSFSDWMAAAPRSCANEKEIFEFMAEGQLTVAGDEVVVTVLKNAIDQAKKYFAAKLGPALDATEEAFVFANILNFRKNDLKNHGRITSLAAKTAGHVRALANRDKGVYGTTIVNWVKAAEDDYVGRWFEKALTTLTAPDVVTRDADVRDANGIGCNVYTVAGDADTLVGAFELAVAHSTKPNHAERKWIEANGDSGTLRGAARIDFHITAAPCGEQCAELLMRWVATKNYGGKEIYVYTYHDYDGHPYVYKLTATQMLKIARWAMAAE